MLDRRQFLGIGVAAAAAGLAACAEQTTSLKRVQPLSKSVRVRTGQSAQIVEENSRRGTIAWAEGGGAPDGALEGFFDRTSASHGETATLFVRSWRRFRIEAYRMGYYRGYGGRLVTSTRWLHERSQPDPVVDEALGTATCHWTPTWRFEIDDLFTPGSYLFKLVADNGQIQWVPLTVRDDTSRARFVVVNSVTTWQAYNQWGGWSLYNGLTGRADVVSFDRPYALGLGQSNFLFNELPLIFHMEQLGLDVTYWTDLDLHQRGAQLDRHRCMVSLGHDEYWSWQMRESVLRAQNQGLNLALLGANFCYRQIRLEPTELGADRLMVNYRSTADPIFDTDPKLTTVNWSDAPVGRPESEFSGSLYDGFEDPGTTWDYVVEDANSWFWHDTGVKDGTRLVNLEQNEYNRFDGSSPVAANVQILGHSPVPNGAWSDATYLTVPSGAGVFSSGTSTWVLAMSNSKKPPPSAMRRPVAGVTDVVLRAMENLYDVFGRGPAGTQEPSRPNWSTWY